ncbi:MAG: ADOP family duplicated permease [Terriglobia bacterium]
MTGLRVAWSRVRALFRRARSERELDEELRTHLEMLAEENVRKGQPPEEARYAARRQFGGVTQIKEAYRDQRGVTLIETIVQDVRYGLRQLGRNPGFTAVAIITLALGIGANTVIFSAVNAELLHPFAFKHLSRIVTVWESAPKQNQFQVSVAPANFLDWSHQNKTLDLLAADHDWNVNLTGRGLAERVEGYRVTANYFPLLGIAPQSGRFITQSDFHPGQESVVVFSYGFWQRHLGANRSIVGKTVLLNEKKFTVIGIMPKDFDYPLGAEAWSPLSLAGSAGADRGGHYLRVIGRLKRGISAEQAQADLGSIAQRLGRQYPKTNAGHTVQVVGLVQDVTGAAGQFLALLMGAAAFVLLLACANVMNLQLARAAGREKEIGVRLALGGSRWRITRQLLVETLILAALGGLAGALLASWGLHLLLRSLPPFIVAHVAGLTHLRVDSTVMAFTSVVALLAGIIAGLVPARRASHPNLSEVLKEGGRDGSPTSTHQRLRSTLVVVEIALALVLLVGAGLLVEGFRHLTNQDQGFDRRNVLTFSIALPASKYNGNVQIQEFYDRVLQRLKGLPGVESAGAVTSLPAAGGWNQTQYRAEGEPPTTPGEMRLAVWQSATPGFFLALHVPLIKGRLLGAQDGPNSQPVVVISKSMAHRIYPDKNPIGKRIRFGDEESHQPWRTIVGVVGDVKQSPFDATVYPTDYIPFSQIPVADSYLVIRTKGDPLALASAARQQVNRVDPDVPASGMQTLEQVVAGDTSGVASSARTMLVLGLIALILAAAGIFALMAYSVTQRTHEIGVRIALGARPNDIVKMVLGNAIKLAVIGLCIGVPCALAMARAMEALPFAIIHVDPLMVAGATMILALTAVLAGYIPARRAARVDPMVALRHE